MLNLQKNKENSEIKKIPLQKEFGKQPFSKPCSISIWRRLAVVV